MKRLHHRSDITGFDETATSPKDELLELARKIEKRRNSHHDKLYILGDIREPGKCTARNKTAITTPVKPIINT
ncbi:MAG: hypothetical protein U5L95_03160 [Candidatus Saccharibacteria bacterium]|nr:hypothetical protein [Candidatus Saccharibacteria bacterium]